MIVNNEIADNFMETYKDFLLFVYQTSDFTEKNCELLEMLSIGRDQYIQNRKLLNIYKENNEVKLEIYHAIKSLEVNNWVYLRDTTKYSIFLKEDITVSYAVLGLTQPIKEIFGYSGLYLKTGLVSLDNCIVCDGIISNIVGLGSGYKSEFNESFKELKKNNLFYNSPKV